MHDGNAYFELQQTLYTSKNPTRRWLHTSRRDWISDALRRRGDGDVGRALEIGPGAGVYLPLLAELADEVVATDIEASHLRRLDPLATSLPNLRLEVDDATRSKLPDGEFDLILCTEVLEHIPDSAAALREMRRQIAPDGVVVLSTPQRYSPLEVCGRIAFLPVVIDLVRLVYREPVLETGHVNLMTKTALRKQVEAAGFVIDEAWFAGLYLPVVAEALGKVALRAEQSLERRLRGTRLQWLLWTQFLVARPA